MAEALPVASLMRLMAWLSPAFPVGSFSYSSGLERAVEDGLVTSPAELDGWIDALLDRGSAWNDAVLLADAWRRARAGGAVTETADLATALAGSMERHMETTLQGAAFLDAVDAWDDGARDRLPPDTPYCIAVGAVAGRQGVDLEGALSAYLQAWASNLIQAGIRLSVLGQNDGVRLVAGLEGRIAQTAARAARSSLEDLGSAAIAAEIAAMNHETQHSRLFRS